VLAYRLDVAHAPFEPAARVGEADPPALNIGSAARLAVLAACVDASRRMAWICGASVLGASVKRCEEPATTSDFNRRL
jgi:hypothetical protein